MKRHIIIGGLSLLLLITGMLLYLQFFDQDEALLSPIGKEVAKVSRPLVKYTFENLKNYNAASTLIRLKEVLKEEDDYTSYLFTYLSDNKQVSGLANIPVGSGPFPVIVMLRGFVPLEIYETGIGTNHSAEAIAEAGYITLAPDFLGYGQSASPSADVFEERFEKNTTVLDLLASIPTLEKADANRVGIWGHSNGGQIAISILEIMNKPYPTVLWAPVSKPFPYSILYFTDEYDDGGKALRKMLTQFEEKYNVFYYDPANYYRWINKETPIQLHQGRVDEEVPVAWSDKLYKDFQDEELDIAYFTYSQENHNFTQGQWPTTIARTIEFFDEKLK
ncbi:hypothetical protein COW99_02140 [Candidatus Roizmanbacteria bacterium CG22_combo_CG10-13_8_21_14_all_38_20]|uniref:Peptidase S9 prolyl oligopeptidase catalytic domain-containing protein n=1 Tax=Candidatus Roizmanbacteria bacterium CG22_combo_CG10-13_8_21_14_all_38_20 TaxID=1974862 RepID=A0A2H0BVT7_9BACT|nr:prolyl oligopeptidase family serine peptidase [Candidatus Microgenomates bacterium]PIP61803.1 MAG: hypothetical protein COW99_02140 [Candidatus Roizmanbacteria bacterium CG22_combo_CG10-13_8_21_14_all_38_20]PJC31648.1 MAG: hypothetical protein CO050_02450 [Candidatus Roizmanbacteria bacterium CG_4_9_14_0_2_um_filter_38_17]